MDEAKDRGDGAEPATEETNRQQQGGEGGTTRLGMEEGDNSDIPATGGPAAEEDEPEQRD